MAVTARFQSDFTAFYEGVQKARERLGELVSSAAKAGAALDDMGDTKTLSQRFQSLKSDIAPSLDIIKKQFEETGKSLKKIGEQTSDVGVAMTKVTAPIAAAGALGVKQFADFQKEMNKVRAATDPTAADFEKLEAAALDMGAKTSFTATQAATALTELGKAGFSASESIKALPTTLQLAAASNISLGDAASLTANTMKTFGFETTQLAHMNDVLAKAVNASTIDITDLRESLKYAGPVAKGLNVSLEETTAAIALMGEAGIKGSLAGTSMRNSFTRLLTPTKQVSEVMEKLGLDVLDTNGNLLPMADILDQLQASGASTADVMNLFGQRAGPSLVALLAKGGDALRELTATLENSDGVAKRAADTMLQGLGGAFEQMSGSIETASIKFGKELEPSLTSILKVIEKLADFMSTTVIPAFAALPEPIKTASIVLGGLVVAAGPVVFVAGQLIAAFGTVATALGALTLPAGTAAAALAVLTGPIGLAVAAVAALGLAWYAFGDDIKAAVSSAAQTIREWVASLEPVLKPIRELLSAVGDMFEALAQLIGAVAAKVIGYAADMVKGITTWLVDKLKPVVEPVAAVFQKVSTAFGTAKDLIVGYAKAVYEGVKTWLLDKFVGIVEGVKGKVEAVTGFFKDMYDKVVGHSYVPDLMRGVESNFNKLETVMVAPARAAISSVTKQFEQLGKSVTKSLEGALGSSGIGGFLSGALGGLVGGGLTALVGGAVHELFNIGGPSKQELEGRKALDDVRKQMDTLLSANQRLEAGTATWKQLIIGARDAYIASGKSAQEASALAEAAAGKVLDATKNGANAVTEAMRPILALIQEQQQDQKDLNDAVQRYKFTIEELGPSLQRQKLSEQAAQLENDFRLLVSAGIDINTVLGRMGTSINDFLNLARRTGSEVPSEMQPILQKMIDLGILTDENGVAFTDLQATGVTFSETMTQGFDRVVKKLTELIDKIASTTGALNAIPRQVTTDVVTRHIDEYESPEPPRRFGGEGPDAYGSRGGLVTGMGIQYLARGGRVLPFMPRGSDRVPAMLTPGESVLNRQATKMLGADAIRALNNGTYGAWGGGGGGTQIAVSVNAVIDRGMSEGEVEERVGKAFVQAMRNRGVKF